MVGDAPLLNLVGPHFFVYCDVWYLSVLVYHFLGFCVVVQFILLPVIVQMLQSQPFKVIQILKFVAHALYYFTYCVYFLQFGWQLLSNILLGVPHFFECVFDHVLEGLHVIQLLLLTLNPSESETRAEVVVGVAAVIHGHILVLRSFGLLSLS